MAKAGSNTRSRYPTSADKPTAPNKTTSIGVKQHNAAITVPTIPVFNNVFFFIILFLLIVIDF